MSIVSVQPKDFILALFIRDDGERFLLGDGGYDFKDSQLHFVGNTIENDEVAKQGTDGTLLAGQVRRSAIQSFDGYIGDATVTKEAIEQMRRDFIAFFMKGHHFRVVYVDCARNAWQRKGGYLVDAPEVKELWQIHPEYHVALNFEDVNYYVYDENADGDEILAIVQSVPISSEVEGGLEWDANGAISDAAQMDNETKTVSGSVISMTDAVVAPFADVQFDGNTSQDGTPTPSAPVPVRTVTGENVVKICGKNLYPFSDTAWSSSSTSAGWYFQDGAGSAWGGNITSKTAYKLTLPAGTYTATVYNISSNVVHIQACKDGSPNEIVITAPSNINSGNPSSTITLTEPTTLCLRYRVTNPSLGIGNTKVQIEKGTATAYEPYRGQSYEVNLGKNLFDGSIYKENYIIASNGTETSSGGGIITTAIKVEPNTTYTASANFNASTSDKYMRVGIYTSDMTFISRPSSSDSGAPTTFTTPANARYVRLSYFTPATEAQLELGSQATSYAAYFDPIELCGLGDDGAGGYLYKDGIYKNLENGKWYVRKATGKYVYNNDLSENGIGSTYVAMLTPTLPTLPNMSFTDGLFWCNSYTPVMQNNTGLQGTNASSRIKVNTSLDIAGSYAAVRSLAAANNLTIIYPLATPTDTEITNAALVAQLNNLKEGGTLAGVNNIAIVPAAGNETGTLEIQYYTKYSPVPIGGGYVWEEGGEGGPTTVINESIAEVYPVWTVPGPALNPTLENATTGEQIEFVGMVGEGQTLVVDMGAQTALLNGLNVISSMAGEFISLQVGQNTLLYSASGDAGASEIGWSPIVG